MFTKKEENHIPGFLILKAAFFGFTAERSSLPGHNHFKLMCFKLNPLRADEDLNKGHGTIMCASALQSENDTVVGSFFVLRSGRIVDEDAESGLLFDCLFLSNEDTLTSIRISI